MLIVYSVEFFFRGTIYIVYLKEKMQAEEEIIAAILVHTKPKKN